jgi:hypothetical protein
LDRVQKSGGMRGDGRDNNFAPMAHCAGRHQFVLFFQMILAPILRVFSEELLRAQRGILRAYQIIRELDERTLEFLLIFLGIR